VGCTGAHADCMDLGSSHQELAVSCPRIDPCCVPCSRQNSRFSGITNFAWAEDLWPGEGVSNSVCWGGRGQMPLRD
jgi:hypothetical protein